MTMPKGLKGISDNIWDKFYRQFPHLKNAGYTLPSSIELQSCCGLHIIYGLMPGLSYGNGIGRYDPIARNRQKFLPGGDPDTNEARILKRTEDKIASEKYFAIIETKKQLDLAGTKPAGSIIAVTHAQFIIIGKELYDMGFIAIINNAFSNKTNNRIILLFKVANNKNDHEFIKGFSYDKIMATIDKYKLR